METQSTLLTLLVEGPNDERIVRWLLDAARLPVERLKIRSGGGKFGIADILRRPDQCPDAVLIDLDETNVADARARAREQLGQPTARVFCAVPEIEAWLFADDDAVKQHARDDEDVLRIVNRLPLPEEIPEPKNLARIVFGHAPAWDFLRQIDVGRACARCPSLRAFIEGMGELLGVPSDVIGEAFSRTLSRDVIAGLVAELPSATIAWRTSDGETFTAEQLREHIELGSAIGRQYATDLLRISRDFLRRKAQREPS